MATKAEIESRLNAAYVRIEELEGMVRERDERIASLEERFARLEARLMSSSANSSLPPSKNPLHVKRGSKSKSTGRPPGGQSGHEPSFFVAIEPEAVTSHVNCPPATRCDYRLADLSDAPLVLGEDAKPSHQLDLPPLALAITAYRRSRRQCDTVNIG